MKIPDRISKTDIRKAIADLRAGIDHSFGKPTGYLLWDSGQSFAPKAVIGLAARRVNGGEPLHHSEFSSGVASGQAVSEFRRLGFDVRPIESSDVAQERERRAGIWTELNRGEGTSDELKRLRAFRGQRGVWRDKQLTGQLADTGVTVALLHIGQSYADDLFDDGVLYHYPDTENPSTDAADIKATKAASKFELPVFVVVHPAGVKRKIHLGWIAGHDDDQREFLVLFGETAPASVSPQVNEPFTLKDPKKKTKKTVSTIQRRGQAAFRFHVLQRYGTCCCVCEAAHVEVLDAAHICPDEERGSDDPRNGLVFCATHHRAFDKGLFAVHPRTREIRYATPASKASLHVSRESIAHLSALPAVEALAWRWERWDHAD